MIIVIYIQNASVKDLALRGHGSRAVEQYRSHSFLPTTFTTTLKTATIPSPSRQSSSSKYKCDFIDSKCFHVKMVVEMISARQLGPDEKLLQIEAQVYNLVRLYTVRF